MTLELVTTEEAQRSQVDEGEVSGLARHMGHTLRGMGAHYEAQAGRIADLAEQARQVPPEVVSWDQLSALSKQDSAAGLALWVQIKEAAKHDLKSGEMAFDALCLHQETPMDRARFLVLHRALMEEWAPGGGRKTGPTETMLISTMAQAFIMQQYWTEQSSRRMHTSGAEDLRTQDRLKDKRGKWEQKQAWEWGEWVPERVTEKEAREMATAEIDRWNRLFLRTLRQLRDLRRYAPVVIQNAGQVNVGQQQVNVAKTEQVSKQRRPRSKRRCSHS